jgi:hypothetical protein
VGGAVASGEHVVSAFAHGYWHRFFIDATALLMAVIF